MNWEKSILSKIIPISIALTGIGYFMTFLFQMSYLAAYGIPASLVFIKPELLIIGIAATSLALITMVRFYFNVLDLANSSKNVRPVAIFWRSTLVSLLFGGMGLMLAFMSMKVGWFFQLFLTVGGIFILWSVGALILVLFHAVFKSHSFEKSIKRFNPYQHHLPNFGNSKKEESTLDKISRYISTLLFIAGLAVAAGSAYASLDSNKVVYSENDEDYVVISNYQNSLIVKRYDKVSKKLSSDFYLVSQIDQALHTEEIKFKK